jgi:hypothetical protein
MTRGRLSQLAAIARPACKGLRLHSQLASGKVERDTFVQVAKALYKVRIYGSSI